MSLVGTELVSITGISATGFPSSVQEQTTTQAIADLGGGSGSLIAPTIDVTGTWNYTPAIVVVQPFMVTIPLINAAVNSGNINTESFLYNENGGHPGLVSLAFDLTGIKGSFDFSGDTFLTSIAAVDLVAIGGDFSMSNGCAAVTSIDLSALEIIGGSFQPSDLTSLTALDLSSLKYIGRSLLPVGLSALTELDLPSLEFIGDGFQAVLLDNLTSVNCPVLATIQGSFEFGIFNLLASASLPALTKCGGYVELTECPALTNFTLPAIVNLGGRGSDAVKVHDNVGALTTFTLGASLKSVTGNVTMSSCALGQAVVDQLLVRLAALDGTNGTTSFDNYEVTITGTSDAPSATGLTAKTTLEGRGNTVTVNS